MHMKTGVEQAVYALLLLEMLPDRALLPGEAIGQQLGASPTYFQKLLRKLVAAGIVTSVPGIKGGFRLKKKTQDIRIYDVYVAVEGQQSLYSSHGTLIDMLDLEQEEDSCCLLDGLMEEAESAWKAVLKRETIASLAAEMHSGRFQDKVAALEQWMKDHLVT